MCRFCYVVVSSKLQNSRLVYKKKRGGGWESLTSKVMSRTWKRVLIQKNTLVFAIEAFSSREAKAKLKGISL